MADTHSQTRAVDLASFDPALCTLGKGQESDFFFCFPSQTAGGGRACDTCMYEDVAFPVAPPSKRCMHTATVCTRCFLEHIRSGANSRLPEIGCPSDSCDIILTRDEVVHAAKVDYMVLVHEITSLLPNQTQSGHIARVQCDCHICSRASGNTHSQDSRPASPPVSDEDKDSGPASPASSVYLLTTNDIPDPEPAPTIGTCAVCSEENLTLLAKSPSDRCAHGPTLCGDCLFEHVRTAIADSGLVEVDCPVGSCGAVLTYSEVNSAARGDSMLIERFDSLQMKQALGADENFVWCLNPNCGSGQYHEDGIEAPIVTCFRCNTKSCFEHKILWHEDFTCSEYNADVRPLDQASADFIDLNTKGCPGCKSRIEKNEGCDHMTCTRCGHEFCWLCLADYNSIRQNGNAYHNEGCQYRA